MMNVVALCFVLTSLATAGVWSPSPEKRNQNDQDVIVKEGHRVVVVEYEKEYGDTKVLISPHEAELSRKPSDGDGKGYISGAGEKLLKATTGTNSDVEQTREKLKEQDLYSTQEEQDCHRPGTKELVCDTLGKCKHKIASALGKTKDKVSEKAHEVSDKVYEVEEAAKEAVSEVIGSVKDTVAQKSHEASQKAWGVKEKVKDTVGETTDKAKEALTRKFHEVQEGAKEATQKAKHAANYVGDMSKTTVEDVERNASREMETAKGNVTEKAKQAADKVKGSAQRIKEKGKHLSHILHQCLEIVYNVGAYLVTPETLHSLMGVVHLLGFSTAYGTCVWVTFVSSYVLARALPRQQFGVVQSRIYPVYFRAMAYSVGVALLGDLLSQRRRLFSNSTEMFQSCALFSSLLMVLTNLLYLEPRATKVQLRKIEVAWLQDCSYKSMETFETTTI